MQYDDGDTEMLDLAQEKVDWREAPPAPEKPNVKAQEGEPAEAGAAAAPQPPKDVPAHVAVVCNDKRGMFDVKGMCIVMDGGRTVSATEFERLAGKAASKKWKSSIRVDKVWRLPSPVAQRHTVDTARDGMQYRKGPLLADHVIVQLLLLVRLEQLRMKLRLWFGRCILNARQDGHKFRWTGTVYCVLLRAEDAHAAHVHITISPAHGHGRLCRARACRA